MVRPILNKKIRFPINVRDGQATPRIVWRAMYNPRWQTVVCYYFFLYPAFIIHRYCDFTLEYEECDPLASFLETYWVSLLKKGTWLKYVLEGKSIISLHRIEWEAQTEHIWHAQLSIRGPFTANRIHDLQLSTTIIISRKHPIRFSWDQKVI